VPQQGRARRARLAIQTALAGGRLVAAAVATTLMLLLAFPLVYLVIIAASRYWERCEIGINANANVLWLLFGKAPLLVVEQYAACGLAWALTIGIVALTCRRRTLSPTGLVVLVLGVGVVAMLAATVAQAWMVTAEPFRASYPTDCASPGLLDPLVKLRG